jgi:hypothetical protein
MIKQQSRTVLVTLIGFKDIKCSWTLPLQGLSPLPLSFCLRANVDSLLETPIALTHLLDAYPALNSLCRYRISGSGKA